MYIDDLARSAALAALAEGLEIAEAESDLTDDERHKIRLGTLIKAEREFKKSFAPDAKSAATQAWARAVRYATEVAKGEIESDGSLTAAEGAALLLERRNG